jgi:putative Mn2+ efflux pump MntP
MVSLDGAVISGTLEIVSAMFGMVWQMFLKWSPYLAGFCFTVLAILLGVVYMIYKKEKDFLEA